MINTNYFSVSTYSRKQEQEKGRLDMLDSASDDNIEIDIEGQTESASLIDKTKSQAKDLTKKIG